MTFGRRSILLLAVSACLWATSCRKWDNPLDPTDNLPPELPSQPFPDSGAAGLDTGLTLRWSCADPDSADTLSYILCLGDTPEPPVRDSGLAATSYRPTGLAWLTRYYWRVVAQDNRGGRTEGPLWQFTTVSENHPPAPPSSPRPDSGAVELGVRSVLSWRASDPDPGDTLEFDIYLGTASQPSQVATGVADTFYAPANLKYDSTYYWRVVCRDRRGAETTGPTWRFRTMTGVTVSAPVTGERMRMLTTYVIRWSGGPRPTAAGGRPVRKSRNLRLDAAPDSTVVYYSVSNGASWTRLGQPFVGGQYSWSVPATATVSARVQVRAYIPGDTVTGTTGAFTIYDTLPPSSLTITAPTAASRWTLGETYSVTWTGGTDGMDSCVISYSADSGATWQRQGSTKNAGSFNWTPLGPASTRARVRVAAYCLGATSTALSPVFQTLESPYPDSLLMALSVGARPVALCYDSIDNRLFCATYDDSSIAVVNGQSNTVTTKVRVAQFPNALLWTPTTNKVLCTTDSGKVVIVRAATNTVARTLPVGRRPSALCWSRGRNRAYVANSGDSTVSVIDCSGDSLIATIAVGKGPRSVVWNPVNDRVYVSDSSPTGVSVIDCASNAVIATVALAVPPHALLVDESNNVVYAAIRAGNTLIPIDAATNQVLPPVTVGHEPWALAWNEGRGRLYTLNSQDNNISIVNTATRQVVMGLPVGNQPRSAYFARPLGKLYVANYGANSLTIVDGAGDRIVRFLGVGSRPVAVCWNSVANKVYTANSEAGSITIIIARGKR
jgi:YVTN family beta-propeller protein